MINYDHFNLLMYNIISGHNQLRLSKNVQYTAKYVNPSKQSL